MTDVTELPEAARAFADGSVDLLPTALDARALAGLIDLLVARADAARLTRLAASPDKGLAKAARRGLHLLRTRGVSARPAPRAFKIERGPYQEEPSIATHIDGRGERMVFVGRAAPDGGIHVFQARVSDERGLLDFVAGALSRKDWRTHARGLGDDTKMVAAQVPEAHARWLIERAYQLTLASGRAAPPAFAEARLTLGVATPPASHPVLALAPPLPRDEARPRLAEAHTLEAIGGWLPPEDLIRELDLEAGQITTSRLIVEPQQRALQLEAAIDKLADRALASPFRARLADRLRETAYLYALRGRLDDARLLTAAAELTDDPSVAGSANPIVRRLFDKLVDKRALLEPAKR